MGMKEHRTFSIRPPASHGRKLAARGSLDLRGWLLAVGCFLSLISRADNFGDISVSADSMYSGNTFHGYAEMRVTLENRSGGRTHLVTLNCPNNAYGNYGNSISRLSRSAALAPGARQLVTLLQPPLPASGDGSIGVEVDGRHEGEIRAPNANNHCNSYSRGGQAATVFISRSLDFDAVARVLNAGRGAFTATMATGPPDAVGGGYQPNTWMPDTRRYSGLTNWLELDYATPQPAGKISIYSTQSPALPGVIELTGVSATNILRIPMSSGSSSSSGSGWLMEYSFPATGAPVKTVRLDFGKAPPYNIAIDAVQISGPSGSQWASDARASSDNSASAGSYAPGRTSVDSVEGLRAEMPASAWSADWLAYTPFDAIALQPGDLASMSPQAAAALWNYVQAGGNLFVFGNNGLPEAWRSGTKKSLQDGTEYNAGLGRCFIFAPENPAALDPQTVRTVRAAVNDAAHYWQSIPQDSAAANSALPLVENLKIPARGIVFIMLLFIIVIGPVNIIVLNRRRRRTWMLWTIPAISFATTLLVFAYSLLREGVTPTARIAGLTVLNQAAHQAETVGAEGFYCPLTPGGGLHFDPATEATPLVEINYSSGSSREVDWSQAQHFSRGWVSARVPAFFHLRKSETRRERVQIENKNGHLQIVNGLGAPIKSLWMADAGMNIYEAQNVAAGQTAGLIPSKLPQPPEKSGAAGLLRDIGFTARADALDARAGNYLSPNTYIAVLDGNPFLENALGPGASLKRTKSSAVVFGTLGAADLP